MLKLVAQDVFNLLDVEWEVRVCGGGNEGADSSRDGEPFKSKIPGIEEPATLNPESNASVDIGCSNQ